MAQEQHRLVDADAMLKKLFTVPMSASQRNAIADIVNSEAFLPDDESHHRPQAEHCSGSTRLGSQV